MADFPPIPLRVFPTGHYRTFTAWAGTSFPTQPHSPPKLEKEIHLKMAQAEVKPKLLEIIFPQIRQLCPHPENWFLSALSSYREKGEGRRFAKCC